MLTVASQIAVDAPCAQPDFYKFLRIFPCLEALRKNDFFHGLRILVLIHNPEVIALQPDGNA